MLRPIAVTLAILLVLGMSTSALAIDRASGNAVQAISLTGGDVVTEMTIKTAPRRIIYVVGHKLNLAGLEVTLTRASGSSETIAFADFESKGITTVPAGGNPLVLRDYQVVITHTESGVVAKQSIGVLKRTVNPRPIVVVPPPAEEPPMATGIIESAGARASIVIGPALSGTGEVTIRANNVGEFGNDWTIRVWTYTGNVNRSL
jgi:hypothetical protein